MKVTIAYWTNPNGWNGNITINCRRIEEVITGENAKDCMQQIEHKRANNKISENSPIEIVNIED